jgi:hypothetical protein
MVEMERQASEEEAEEKEKEAEEQEAEEKETSKKKAYHSMADVLADLEVEAEEEEVVAEDPMGLDASDLEAIDPKLASIFTAADEEEDEDDSEDEDESEDESEDEEEEKEEKETSKKKASYRPSKKTRQASVKTLGNISREASSSDELSKLWESAPDVSKFFG